MKAKAFDKLETIMIKIDIQIDTYRSTSGDRRMSFRGRAQYGQKYRGRLQYD